MIRAKSSDFIYFRILEYSNILMDVRPLAYANILIY
jgi:hypothetical protein